MPNDKAPKLSLSDPIQFLKGVGPKRAQLLRNLGLQTIEDALLFFPHRYEDRSKIQPIGKLVLGEPATFTGKVLAGGSYFVNRRRKIFELIIEDDTGVIRAKWFRFQEDYLNKRFPKDSRVIISGKPTFNKYLGAGMEIIHPNIERLSDDPEDHLEMGRIVPVYPATEGLHIKFIRKMMHQVVENHASLLPEFLPDDLLRRHRFPERAEAIRLTHFPSSAYHASDLNVYRTPAQRRLIFEEMFLIQLGVAYQKKHFDRDRKSVALKTRGPVVRRLVKRLPFELTSAQKRVLSQIMDDLESHRPMNRLLHGDVGSGKTIIALICLLTAVDNAAQAALMVPTEILAEQHYLSLLSYCKPLGITLELITSATPAAEKKRILKAIQTGSASLLVGTHALIQQDVQFKNLALAVVDEQHRFGVLQREALGKKGAEPHVLVMSATPIPRSMALVVYGHMDVSVLDEMPPGRQPIITQRHSAADRDKAYEVVRNEIKNGRQAYIVAPLIEESESRTLKTVIDIQNELQSVLAPGASVGLLHGRMKKEERQAVMERFLNRSIDILVATTVIEVGIDVPNATVMVIEHAERFGLAQLHQLRGRVGRGDHASYCMLVTYDSVTEDGQARLQAMVDSNNGFEIAERDLEIRGPGDFLGTRQSGLPTLRIAQLVRDLPIIEIARKEAFALIDRDPLLEAPGHQALKQTLKLLHGSHLDLLKVL